MNKQTERKSEVQQPPSYTMPLSSAALKEIFSDCYDFEMRDVNVGGGERRLKLCFIDGLVSGDAV